MAQDRLCNNNNKNPNHNLTKFPSVTRNGARIFPCVERAREGPKHFKLERLILPLPAQSMRNWAALCSEVELPIRSQDDCKQGRLEMEYFAGIDVSLRALARFQIRLNG
jgi:hypothetical protein